MSAPKKIKIANVQASVTERNDVKGKGKAIPPPVDTMDVDEPSEDDENSSLSESEGDDEDMADSGDSMDTEDEIELAQQPTKSKQTLKRKRRAIPTSSFGQALTALLDTSTTPKTATKPKLSATTASNASPETVPKKTEPLHSTSTQSAPDTALLSLKKTPTARKRRAEEKSEAKAAKAQLGERKEREDRNRVTDVIGGWGGESERALRKVAQRGVVKLFNVIQQAQQSTNQATSEASAVRGTGKASLPAPSADGFRDEKKKVRAKGVKDNAIGRAKPATLGQEDFLQSIRSGGIVSKV